MPFTHCHQNVQDKLKTKTSNNSPKKRHADKPLKTLDQSLGGKIEPFKNQDDIKMSGLDRSMQMMSSVSFKALHSAG